MIIETNLVDISKITLENYATYSERIKYEILYGSYQTKRKLKRGVLDE